MNFKESGVSEKIIKGLEKQKITEPTQVQQDTYADIINNNNLIVKSQTGSGKTLAYLIPAYDRIDLSERANQMLVLVPTQELAVQVHRQIELLSKNSGIDIRSVVVIGNGNIKRQADMLKEKPQIVIGTAARVLELIKMKKITAHTLKTIVIDEADKMLDKNNIDTVKAVRKCAMRDTQILMFSASITDKTIEHAREFAENFKVVKCESEQVSIPKNIKHIFFIVENRERIEMLRKVCKAVNPEKAIIFINRPYDIEEATQKLQYHQYKAENIHGKNDKNDRKNVINDFRTGKLQYLIASDIAARGLHIDGISTVINITMPEDPNDYLHRAGRCGRNDTPGLCISIITEKELPLIKKYQKAFGINIVQKRLYQGKVVSK